MKNEKTNPPVVAILGHVDHGKTSLLDAIRKTSIAAREHGGITQAIGAFTSHGITFIDTPGHQAFAKMRGRGAQVCDIAILVVAATDGVMPQTKESIVHIQEAKIPYIVALTKIDLPTADEAQVKKQLLKESVSVEGLGGDIPAVGVSSKTGAGIEDLLETILLVAQVTGITQKDKTKENFKGVVIESKLDRKKGVLATVIVKSGTVTVGDQIIAEKASGKVRALVTDAGVSVKQATPGMPVEIMGFTQVPAVGATVVNEKQTQTEATEDTAAASAPASEVDPSIKRLPLIVKADTQGALEAVLQSLPRDNIRIMQATTGDPTGSDVLLAKTSNALIVGFNTQVSSSVSKLAESEGVLVKTYKLIYELLDEVTEVVDLFKQGKPQEIVLGKAQIMAIFPYENKKVAGSKVLEGRIARGDKIRIERDGESVGETRVASIRRGKDDVGKAEMGSECGILLATQLDFQPQDMILSVR